MSKFFQLQSYLTYWLDQVDEHSLHSPFLYDLYTQVIHRNESIIDESLITQLREKLLTTDLMIEVADFGAGAVLTGRKRNVKDIARTSLSPRKYSALYARLIHHFKCREVVELGTSLGINALYLAGNPGTRLTTFEGASEIASVARNTVEFAGMTNIQIIEGEIRTTLPQFIAKAPKIDFAFLDAHHRYEPTIRYFETLLPRIHDASLILIDDIHYTAEMEQAWKQLKTHPLVHASVDLYRVGMLFFDPSLNKQHVVIQF